MNKNFLQRLVYKKIVIPSGNSTKSSHIFCDIKKIISSNKAFALVWLVVDFYVSSLGCWAIIELIDHNILIPRWIKFSICLIFGIFGMCMNFNPYYKVKSRELDKLRNSNETFNR